VFKCTISKFNIVYQATPCADAGAEQKIDIKPRSAEAEAAAAAGLKAWETDYAKAQAAEKKALKAKQDKLPRQIIVEVVQRRMPRRNLYHRRLGIGRRVNLQLP
jgi:hypothetical protein